MTVTMDAAGRIVLPKAVRERIGLTPGAALEVRIVDGRVELEPAAAEVRIEKKGDFWVARHVGQHPPLTPEQVSDTTSRIRERDVFGDE